jgi:phosphatidylglycerol:prolipoprotein diacylglycerol transferase
LGTVLVCWTARRKGIPVLPAADAILARLPFGFALGKAGCFLAGCCYGRRCDGFPGVRFAVGSLAQRTQAAAGQVPAGSPSLPVHPTQLYELAFGLLFPLLLLALERRSRRPGEVSLALYAGYSLWRFSIEFLRADPGRDAFGGPLSDSQLTALAVLPACAVLWFLLRRRGPERRTSPVDGPTS